MRKTNGYRWNCRLLGVVCGASIGMLVVTAIGMSMSTSTVVELPNGVTHITIENHAIPGLILLVPAGALIGLAIVECQWMHGCSDQ